VIRRAAARFVFEIERSAAGDSDLPLLRQLGYVRGDALHHLEIRWETAMADSRPLPAALSGAPVAMQIALANVTLLHASQS
jgi:hypothetical protein